MKNLVLFIKNINNYGFIVFIKIFIFEIFYTFKALDFKSLKYEVFKDDIYELTKKNKIYNTPYIPTPYFFLKIVRNFFIKRNIKKIVLVDLGCGYSRSERFFKRLSSFFLGFDYNLGIIKQLNNQKIKNSRFYNINLRDKNAPDFLIKKILKYKKKNNEIVIFFSDSFDLSLLNIILEKLSKKFRFYCIFINFKNKHFFKKKQKFLFLKVFKNKRRNIYITKLN